MAHIASGVILLWSGAIVDIPAGWLLCDGTLGTPDLRDRFLVGSGSTYAVDEVGGSVEHNHDFTGVGHTHTLVGGAGLTAGAAFDLETSSTAVTGTTDNKNGLPPFFSLAFIMKT